MNPIAFRLRSDLHIAPVRSGNDLKYIVDDKLSGRIVRLGKMEYTLCSLFVKPMLLNDAIEILQAYGESEGVDPGKLQKLVSWLMQSGLLEPATAPEFTESALQDTKSSPLAPKPKAPVRPFDPSFVRFPLLSGKWIHYFCQPWKFLVSWPSLICAISIWVTGAVYAFSNWQELNSVTSELFIPGSQWWWLIAWLILKAVHEAGHAIACERVHVRTSGAGVGFIFFAPSPYVDVSRLWTLENKWYRMLVSSAGMIFELTLAAICAIVACSTENNNLRYLCASIASLGTVTTFAFNANPLMRYDGYYIMIDWLGRPNLWQDANRAMRGFVRSLITKDSEVSYGTPMVILYGIASWISRMVVIITMGWGVFIAWDGVGLAIVSFFVGIWFVFPFLAKRTTSQSPQAASLFASICPKKTLRASLVGLGVALLGFAPSPLQVVWPGVVDFVEPQELRTDVSGFIRSVHAYDGHYVTAGTCILELSNPDVELECERARTEFLLCSERCNSLRTQQKLTELQNEESLLESLRVKLQSLEKKVESLQVRAQRDGVLIARDSKHWTGSFLQEGAMLGLIANPSQLEVRASIPQSEWDRVSRNLGKSVMVYRSSDGSILGQLLRSMPHAEQYVDYPSLAAIYGGPLVVSVDRKPDGSEELKTDQPRLAAHVELSNPRDRLPQIGSVCTIRFSDGYESIWKMLYRNGAALLDRKLPTTIDDSNS